MNKVFQSRRYFLKGTAAISLAGIVSPSSLMGSDLFQEKKKLGVALVGLGNYSEGILGKALQEAERCYLAGVVSGTPAKAKQWSKQYGFPEKNIYDYKAFKSIADNKDIDIVYVVTPNSLHAEHTITALEAGKHVICEKPMAMNAAEAMQMINAAKKVNRKLAIGYRMHYDLNFIEAKRLGQSQDFGPVNYIESALGYSFAPEPDSWKVKKAMGGGSLYNLGVYPIQSARHVKGSEPAFVTAQATTRRKEIFKEIAETFTWQLEWADGTLCNSYSGPVAFIDRLFAGCTDGFIELDPATQFQGVKGKSTKGDFRFDQVFQQKLQVDDFARCVTENKQSIVSGEEGWKDMLIVDAIHKALASGRKEKVG
ncbi:MAG: Gfo/Idh/MocA family oxidoreductase [Cyclobacteriaceae bacterium]